MNVLMSYNKNEGYGALGRYVELTNNLLKLSDTKIFFISPKGYNRSHGSNFFHLGYKKINFKPYFIYGWFMIIFVVIKNLSKIKNIDKCVLFNGSNSFIFAFLKFFFNYEHIYSVRVNIILNEEVYNSLQQINLFKLIVKKIQFKFYNFLECYIIRKSEKIVFQSRLSADEYKKMYKIDENKIFILYNNCNPTWVGGKRILKLPIGFNIGFIGNLYLSKGLKVILDAIKLLKKEHNCYLTVIGDGPDKKFLSNYAKVNLLKNVKFLGHKKNACELMHNFNLIIVPSFVESFPNVALESLYYNTPVFGSDVGGISLILEQEFLFKPGDYRTLANKIIKILDTDNYNRALKTVTKLKNKFLFDWGNEFFKIINH